MPGEAVAFSVNFDNISDDRVFEIDDIITNVGFHSASGEMAGGDFTNFLNYQPFEDTDENRRLIEKCVSEISDKFPDMNVEYQIRYSKDGGSITDKRCDMNVTNAGKEDNVPDTAVNTTEDSDSPDWRATLADSDDEAKQRVGVPRERSADESTSTGFDDSPKQGMELPEDSFDIGSKKIEQTHHQHQIHSYADIEHTIRYTLDENSEDLVFESMERGGLSDSDGLEYAVKHNSVHCTCGETNMTKGEAVEHLNQHS